LVDASLVDASLVDASLVDASRGDAAVSSGDAGPCPSPSVWLGDICVDPACAPTTCSGHGSCDDSGGAPSCTCDAGFTGARCDAHAATFYDRVLLVHDLADPDVVEASDDLYFMSGTQGGRRLPIYRSTDLVHFELSHHYDPSATDPAYDYCNVWAPDLSRHDGVYHLYFSAHRVPQGSACPGDDTDVTNLHTSPPDEALVFGAPQLINEGTSFPRSRVSKGCPADGCSHVIRIDSSIFQDGESRWLAYVWFQGGNNISSFRLEEPGQVVDNAGPFNFGDDLSADEESINEGPDIFERDGRYYLFFSTAWFNSQYAMRYVMAPSVAELTRERYVRRHSYALRGEGGALLESHGHNTIVERRGEYFNVFHQGVFEDGTFRGRDTHIQRIAFRDDGSIHSLNGVDVRWGALEGHRYSLDLVLRDGSVVGPCISVGVLDSDRHAAFTGVCPSASHRVVEKSKVGAFRLYYSADDTWTRFVDVAYDGVSDDVFVALPGAETREVALRWNELETGAAYSLDVQRHDGTWVAPCDGEYVLGHRVEHTFDGHCDTPGVDIALTDVQRFRVCSATGGDWAHARCGSAAWDGASTHLAVHIP
jgi:hypothetical protein